MYIFLRAYAAPILYSYYELDTHIFDIYIWRFYIQWHFYGVLCGFLMFLCFLAIFHVCDLMYLENVLYANLKQNLRVSLLTGFDF